MPPSVLLALASVGNTCQDVGVSHAPRCVQQAWARAELVSRPSTASLSYRRSGSATLQRRAARQPRQVSAGAKNEVRAAQPAARPAGSATPTTRNQVTAHGAPRQHRRTRLTSTVLCSMAAAAARRRRLRSGGGVRRATKAQRRRSVLTTRAKSCATSVSGRRTREQLRTQQNRAATRSTGRRGNVGRSSTDRPRDLLHKLNA
jgi:hypothetical protein